MCVAKRLVVLIILKSRSYVLVNSVSKLQCLIIISLRDVEGNGTRCDCSTELAAIWNSCSKI